MMPSSSFFRVSIFLQAHTYGLYFWCSAHTRNASSAFPALLKDIGSMLDENQEAVVDVESNEHKIDLARLDHSEQSEVLEAMGKPADDAREGVPKGIPKGCPRTLAEAM